MVLLELPLIVLLYKIFEKKLLTREQEAAALAEVSYGKLYETVSSIGHSKKNQIGWLLEDRFQKAARNAIESVVKEVRIGYVYGIVKDNMDVFLRVFLFFYGGFSVINGNMTVGEFTILYSYVALVITSCGFFLELGKSVQKNKAHYLRIKEISDMPEETNGTDYPSTIQEISFTNVNFSYNGKENVLQGFNQTLKRGKLYAVIGENGTGKSTMLSLLVGMYIDDYIGEITYNGKNIKELDMRRIRKEKIAVCEQEPFLLDDTIRFNVTYSNDICDDRKIMELAMKLNFDAFLSKTDDGISTVVGQNGSALSGGQKQKTALLKVFYKNAEILILDEPTSAMDEAGKEKLKAYLQEIKEDKIILIVTHDTMLMDNVDEVIRM